MITKDEVMKLKAGDKIIDFYGRPWVVTKVKIPSKYDRLSPMDLFLVCEQVPGPEHFFVNEEKGEIQFIQKEEDAIMLELSCPEARIAKG